MNLEELQLFLEGEQGVTGTNLSLCQKLIDLLEPSKDARVRHQLLFDGFTKFIISDACSIVGTAARMVTQDMNKPFAQYYISSSNNT